MDLGYTPPQKNKDIVNKLLTPGLKENTINATQFYLGHSSLIETKKK